MEEGEGLGIYEATKVHTGCHLSIYIPFLLGLCLASSPGLQRKGGGLVHTAGVLVRMRIFPQILGNLLPSVKYL